MPSTAKPLSTERVGAAMWAGMRYVRFAPPIHSVLLRSGGFIISASALWSLLPLVAKEELHRDSTGYGVLLGCLGVGSILGALMLHRLRQMFSPDTMVTAAVALFGAANVLMAYLSSYAARGSRAHCHRRRLDDREFHAHHRDPNIRAGLGARTRAGRLSIGLPGRNGRGQRDLGRGCNLRSGCAARCWPPASRCSSQRPPPSGCAWPDCGS